MSYIAWFKDLTKDSIPIAGGKGANLGEMTQLSLPVPYGFAITAQCYGEYIERTGLKNKINEILVGLDSENNDALQKASVDIAAVFNQTPIPEDMSEEIMDAYELLGTNRKKASDFVKGTEVFVAVRSSATAEDLPSASFAGQQATFLNVKGKNNVIKAVRDCWASLFTARAIYYRVKNKFDHDKVLISAIVQKMVNSDKAGIMFTINPATNDAAHIVIEGIYGLGEMIVGGDITPDLYIVEKSSREITSREIRKQTFGLFRKVTGDNERRDIDILLQDRQKINDAQVKELARLGKKLEEHYGCPQDIEWAIEGDDVCIVQTRAVTTFKKSPTPQSSQNTSNNNLKGKEILKGEIACRGAYTGIVKVVHDISELGKVTKGDIMVTTMTMPDMVPAMQRAGAIVTDEGGMTCHAAIVSREMGTPCLVGTQKATQILKDNQKITVDAFAGVVYDGEVQLQTPSTTTSTSASEFQNSGESIITATEIKIVLDLPYRAKDAAATGADGIGLIRSEIIIAQGGIHPAEYLRQNKAADLVKLLKDGLKEMAQAFAPRPVWVRTSDMRSDEYRNLQGGDKEPHESDPMIGWHGIRRHLDEKELLKTEFMAIKELHDEGIKNVGVMIPFVIRANEVAQAKEIMRSIGLEPCRDVEFGIMCETPAACWVMEDICREGISFVSFGTNDLTQLTLGLDRNNAKIAHLFDEMHPAVLHEIEHVLKVCAKYHVKASICGQAGSRPEMAEFLVRHGCDSISANFDAVQSIRHTVARIEKKLLLEKTNKR